MNNDKDFDELITSTLSDLPPKDVVREVTPWRKAFTLIIIGLALCGVTFEFEYLRYILPTVGLILQLLGFRTLRQENVWFKICWVVTAINIVMTFAVLSLTASILRINMITDPLSMLNLVLTAVIFIKYIAIWCGIREVQKKAGIPVHAGAATALLVWQIIVYYLAIQQANGETGIFVLFIFVYFAILYMLSKELDEAGYAIKTISARWSDLTVAIGLVAALAIGIACSYVFFNGYHMEWSEAKIASDPEITSVKQQLVKLGFPENVLIDMTEEDILSCKDAVRVKVDYDNIFSANSSKNDLEDDLKFTEIAVGLSGNEKQWIIIHHFQWITEPDFYGTECIKIIPVSIVNGWLTNGEVTGQVLYDAKDMTYSAPYHYLDNMTYDTNIILTGQCTTDIFGAFSFNNKGENYRGYVAYSTYPDSSSKYLSSYMEYTHQNSWKQYPALTAMEDEQRFFSKGAFTSIRDILQFDITE